MSLDGLPPFAPHPPPRRLASHVLLAFSVVSLGLLETGRRAALPFALPLHPLAPRRCLSPPRLSAARQFHMCSRELSPVCLFVDASRIHGCARVCDTNVCLSFKGLRSHDRLHLISAAFEDNAVHMLVFFFLSLHLCRFGKRRLIFFPLFRQP